MHNMYSCIVICQAYMLLKLYHHFSSEALEKTHADGSPSSGTRRKIRQDEDGDEAHEFLVEDEESHRRKDGWKEQKQWKLVYIIPQDFGNQKVVLAAGSSVINWCGVFWGHPISQNWPPRFRLLRSSGMPESARGCHLSQVVCHVGYQSKFWEILTSIFINVYYCLFRISQVCWHVQFTSIHSVNACSTVVFPRRLESSKCVALQVSSRRPGVLGSCWKYHDLCRMDIAWNRCRSSIINMDHSYLRRMTNTCSGLSNTSPRKGLIELGEFSAGEPEFTVFSRVLMRSKDVKRKTFHYGPDQNRGYHLVP